MTGAGLRTSLDMVGNLIGRLEGARAGGEAPSGQDCSEACEQPALLPVVMTGSHLDTVPAGCILDGGLGIVAAIECVQGWREEGQRPRLPVELVAFVEEGTRFGNGVHGEPGHDWGGSGGGRRGSVAGCRRSHLSRVPAGVGARSLFLLGAARRDPREIRCCTSSRGRNWSSRGLPWP